MAISVFDIFKVGIGPSSSHTVGPMRAALTFVKSIEQHLGLSQVNSITIELFGSLAATGKGHGSNKAVMLGLLGESPETTAPDKINERITNIEQTGEIKLLNTHTIQFNQNKHILFRRKSLPFHANGMSFIAKNNNNDILLEKNFYSVGGGFIVTETNSQAIQETDHYSCLPYPFKTADELLNLCLRYNCSISHIMFNNEKAWLSEAEIKNNLLAIWSVMQQCVKRGLTEEGILPGGMKVKRRAAGLYQQLIDEQCSNQAIVPMGTLDWVNLYALAVSEENAAGGRVVTAPTNGAAGIIPAVLHYYCKFCKGANNEGVIKFLLTAAAIGILYKENASISGAEVGCQGEVGVACSMAAGALAEVLGGTPEQVENAAEIGMEHNLGLTCDPVGGLVQVPCIERNAMGSVKAINAARIALRGDGTHFVSLDKVIKTMRETGADMKTKYKETSRGGLAVNLIEC